MRAVCGLRLWSRMCLEALSDPMLLNASASTSSTKHIARYESLVRGKGHDDELYESLDSCLTLQLNAFALWSCEEGDALPSAPKLVLGTVSTDAFNVSTKASIDHVDFNKVRYPDPTGDYVSHTLLSLVPFDDYDDWTAGLQMAAWPPCRNYLYR